MKKIKKNLLILLIGISVFINIFVLSTKVTADVGSFEDYGGGSSWDSESSWDSGSSWDSYDSWDSSDSWDSDYSTGSLSFDYFWIFIMAMVVIYMLGRGKSNTRANNHSYYERKTESYTAQDMHNLEVRQTQIENKIQENDPNFNKEEFVAWSKNLFIKLQQAWTDRDWSTIRTFETESLFEQHKNQLQGYIDNNQINVMDRICVNYAHLYSYMQQGDKEILVVRLNSRMQDYIIDATTKTVLKGNKDTDIVNTYLLTFIRKNGVKTKEGTIEVNTTNCPNCGAPTQITSAGECEYCGSVITTGEYNWVLSNLEREKVRL